MFREKAAQGHVYVIAELAANHNGDMNIAKDLINAAVQAKADCVKFQSWSKDTVFSKVKYEENCFIADDYRSRKDMTLEQSVVKYSISEQQLRDMKAHSSRLGIDMTSTPFSMGEADFLCTELDVPFIKIASMDLNNLPFLKYVAAKGRPVLISTGMGTLAEIDAAIRTLQDSGCPEVAVLHCVAEYPPKDELVHLRKMDTLRRLYPECVIGFSDHTLGTMIPIAAIAVGAEIIEKHITLDKTMAGWDHKVSATPDELADIVEAARRIPLALGSGRMLPVESEERRKEFRRSIVARRVIAKGEQINMDMLDYKRPARGISPDQAEAILGRTAVRDIAFDEILYWKDLS